MKNAEAVVRWGGDDFFIGISPSGHAVTMDMNGQRSTAPGPMEMLMISLGGCTGVDVVSILEKKRLRVTAYRVEIKGETRAEYPRGFQKLEVRHFVKGEGLTEDAVKQAVQLSTEKYCSVAASLKAEIVSTFEIEKV